MDNIQGKIFGDFEPPATTDGSYWGAKKNADETRKHFMKKFNQALDETNIRLKCSKTRVTLISIGGGIQLRATLPLKPGDPPVNGRDKKQYTISLGIPANFDGLKTAEEEAYELGKLIARQTFTWTDKYLGSKVKKNESITFKEFYKVFEKKYFETRKRTGKSETTFRSYDSRYKTHFLSDEIITFESIKKIILSVPQPVTRTMCIRVATQICKILNIEYNWDGLSLKAEKNEKYIPSDQEIIQCFEKLNDYGLNTSRMSKKSKKYAKFYKLFFALLAIYGLRPKEIINNSDLDWLVSPENENNTFKVHKSNKTGYREVLPFVPEWVELLELKNEENIAIAKEIIGTMKSESEKEYKVSSLSKRFGKLGFSFTPYSLRHACAIRAHLQGVPIKAAADNLGHTVDIHTKVYQQWFGLENRKKAFEQTFQEMSELDKLKDELAQARKKIAELKLENTRLRLNHSTQF